MWLPELSGGRSKEYILWQNPNPNSSMAAGTIATCSDDFANYDYIAITFKVSSSTDRPPQTTYWKAEDFINYKGVNSSGQYDRGCIGTTDKAQSYIYYRPLRVTDTNKVEFNYGKYTVTSSGTNTVADNNSAVPVQIIGIK